MPISSSEKNTFGEVAVVPFEGEPADLSIETYSRHWGDKFQEKRRICNTEYTSFVFYENTEKCKPKAICSYRENMVVFFENHYRILGKNSAPLFSSLGSIEGDCNNEWLKDIKYATEYVYQEEGSKKVHYYVLFYSKKLQKFGLLDPLRNQIKWTFSAKNLFTNPLMQTKQATPFHDSSPDNFNFFTIGDNGKIFVLENEGNTGYSITPFQNGQVVNIITNFTTNTPCSSICWKSGMGMLLSKYEERDGLADIYVPLSKTVANTEWKQEFGKSIDISKFNQDRSWSSLGSGLRKDEKITPRIQYFPEYDMFLLCCLNEVVLLDSNFGTLCERTLPPSIIPNGVGFLKIRRYED